MLVLCSVVGCSRLVNSSVSAIFGHTKGNPLCGCGPDIGGQENGGASDVGKETLPTGLVVEALCRVRSGQYARICRR